MRKLHLTLLLLMSLTTLGAQVAQGSWKGTLHITDAAKLNLVLHIEQDGGLWKGTMDSPDQMTYGIPFQQVKVHQDSIFLTIPGMGLSIKGKVSSHKIQALFSQNGLNKQMYFDKITQCEAESYQPKRPQTPQPPFSYKTTEVSFSNRVNGITLHGTLTIPKDANKKKVPAILLVAGSGPTDRDETIFEHKPFAVIADYFTKKGYVVLRYDKRGVGKSEGKLDKTTTYDLREDAEAALNYLANLHYVKPTQIGIIGHSEGSTIAIQMASKNQNLNYIVSLGGPGVSGKDILAYQLTRDGANKITFDKILNYIYSTPTSEIDSKKIENTLINGVKNSSTEHLKQLTSFLTTPWTIHFIKYSPCKDLENIKIPILALNGEKDQQVRAKENIEGFKECIKNKALLTTIIYPNLNHLFQNSQTGSPTEYAIIEETINIQILDDISDWILKTIR